MQRFNQNLNYYGTTQIKEFGQFIDEYDVKLEALIPEDNQWNTIINVDTNVEKEATSCLYLIEAENKILNKTFFVFAQLCEEVTCLKSEFNSIINDFSYFDESLNEDPEELKEGTSIEKEKSSLLKISNYLESLVKLKCYFERINEVCRNIVKQLGALFDQKNQYSSLDHSTWNLEIIFEHLSELVFLPLKFDTIVTNSVFKTYWTFYVKQLQALRVNSKKLTVPCEADQINDLIGCVEDISEWFDGNSYRMTLEAIYSAKQSLTIESATILSERFLKYIKQKSHEVSGYHLSLSDFEETKNIIKLNAMINLYHYVYLSIDNKLLKTLMEINEKFCGLPLTGSVMWVPDGFFKRNARKSIKDFDKNDYKKSREAYLHFRKKTLVKDILMYCLQMNSWLVRIDVAFKTTSYDFNLEMIRQKCGLIFEGIHYAEEISFLIKSITSLHQYMQMPMQKNILQSIWKLIEYLQIIHNCFNTNQRNMIETKHFIMQHLQHQILFVIKNSKKKLIDDAKLSNSKKSEYFVDRLLSFNIAEKSMSGPPSRNRINVARLALSKTDAKATIGVDNYDKIKVLFDRLESLAELQTKINQICDTQFFYWHQSFFPLYVEDYYEKRSSQHNLKYLIQSANNCFDSIDNLAGNEHFKSCLNSFIDDHKMVFHEKLVAQICTHIETYIRLDYYTKNSQMAKYNPFTDNVMMLNNIHVLINMAPLSIRGNHIVLKEYIQRYLSNMYYTLASISLHDWKVYKEMRCSAQIHYNLKTIEDQLPKQTLDQGLDILDIMHDIENFVSKYVYNLNYQVFVEQSSNNNFLNTVNINHIANSLRTHGSGIINTTVNYTFQFLRQKFFAFSHFMFDEQIKARLSSDAKYFSENFDVLNQTYEYERANAFNKKIKNLGLSPNGETYMDLFRKLICHIGNAMGYVRMIRSGALHECTEATVYLPVITGDLSFVQYATEDVLSEAAINAAEHLEHDIQSLCKNYNVDTNYFRLLVNTFVPFLRHAENIHLQNFYMIIPPLTINFIEYILKAKEKISKKDKVGALFTDDGFAMGIAYILKLLDQTSDFNSLHWFRSIKNKYIQENEKLVAQQQQLLKGNDDEKLQQTFALTKRRLNMVQQEFDLLYFNLCSAKIFFSDINM